MNVLSHLALTAFLILAVIIPRNSSCANSVLTEVVSNRTTAVDLQNPVVHVWASAGPLAYLSHAWIKIRNVHGQVIGRGVTNDRGTVTIRVRDAGKLITPLTLEAGGGRVLGKPFRGRLVAVDDRNDLSSGVVYLDILSTSATMLEGKGFDYDHALQVVRKTLGIPQAMPADILRVPNVYVDWERLRGEMKRYGGFGRVLKRIRDSARAGEPYTGLAPLDQSFVNSFEVAANSNGTVYPQTTSTVCQGGASSPGNTSTSLIEDIGVAAMKDLGRYAGVPATASEIVVGKVFGIQDESMAGLEDAIKAVQQQLDCISAKIDYLSTQIAYLQIDVKLINAEACKSVIDPAWTNYEYAVNNYPSSNASQAIKDEFKRSLEGVWLHQWQNLATTCGAAINNALFVKTAQSEPAWNLYYTSYYNLRSGWYYPSDVQSMQAFLASWSNLTYEYFVMTNEYYDYKGYVSAAKSSAGYKESNSNYCHEQTSSSTSNFCVWANNISQAYPPSVYSDELAIARTGLAINAVPGIAEQGSPYSYCGYLGCYGPSIPMRLLTAYEIAAYPSEASWGSLFSPAHLTRFNSKPLNTSAENSAVETYEKPRAYRDRYVMNSDITELSSYQAEVRDFFFNALTNGMYVSGTLWQGVTSSQVSFGGFDSVANINKNRMSNNDAWDISINPNAQINNFKSKSYCMAGYDATGMTTGIPCNNSLSTPPHPTLGIILGRTWWPASASAANFSPPDPRCYMEAVPAGLVCP